MYSWQDLDLNQPLNGAHPLNRGRLAWWLAMPLRYGTNDWPDLVSSLNLALTNFASGFGWNTFTNPGGAGSLRFNGTNSNAPTTAFAFNRGESTFAAWLYLTTAVNGTRYTLYDNSSAGASTYPSYEVVGASSSTYHLQIIVPGVFLIGPGSSPSTPGALLNTNTWNHVAYVIDNSATTAYTYVNGVLGASKNYGTVSFGSASQAAVLGRRGNNSQFLPGYLNDISVWGRALGATEIFQLYYLSQEWYPDVLNWQTADAIDGLLSGGGVAAAALLRNFVRRPRFEPAFFE